MKKLFLTAGCLASAITFAGLVVYPEYPAAIERDDEYAVSVTQNGETRALTVYNHCEKSVLDKRTRGGDVNRRFCEFAFDDGGVRVDIRVSRDVSSYHVFPARRALKNSFKDGIISVWLDKPTYFGIRLNDYDKTVLSVFADAPEDKNEIPEKDAPGVMYVDGWVDAPGLDGMIETPKDLKEIYLAPGSVLNARLKITSRNLKMHGRGMVLDPMSNVFRYDQTKNTNRGVLTVAESGVTLDGFKMVDARTFNLLSWRPNVSVRNLKLMSSMMCSDGFTIGNKGFSADNCWIYVGDNALVVSGVNGANLKNIAIGTSCNAIFPQGTNKGAVLENIDVFRADEGLIKNVYNSALRRNNKWTEMSGAKQKKEPGPQDLVHQANEFYFKNLSAVDCVLFACFFHGRNMGTLPKTYTFDGCSVPASTGSDNFRTVGKKDGIAIDTRNNPKKWLITDNFSLSFTNLWIDGVRATFPEKSIAGSDAAKITYAVTDAAPQVPLTTDRKAVSWKTPPHAAKQVTPGENILTERLKAHSIWQRAPSWLVKFEATTRDENGEPIYRLIQCEKKAGMQAIVTENFKAQGNGKWKLSFDARTRSETPFDLALSLKSNEKKFKKELKFLEAASAEKLTEWRRCEVTFETDFDLAVTELVSLKIAATSTADVIEFRNLSLTKAQ